MVDTDSLPVVSGTDPSRCILDNFRIAIAVQITHILPSLTVDAAYRGIDYAKKDAHFSVPLSRFMIDGDMTEHASNFAQTFEPNKWLEAVRQHGPSLSFICNKTTLAATVLGQIYSLTRNRASGEGGYGTNEDGRGKKLVLEYSSPNIAKQFHVGHMRSTIIGGFLNNIYRASGWQVVSLNYLGDWGKQCGLVAVGFEKYGSPEKLDKDGLRHLYDVYVKISAEEKTDQEVARAAKSYFKRMEDGDEEALRNWRRWRADSISKYKKDYQALNISFDEYVGESLVPLEFQMSLIQKAEEMGYVINNAKGIKEFKLEEYGLKNAPLLTIDDTTLYLTRDIGEAIARWDKYNFDKMIYVVSNEQDLHLTQLFKIISLLGYEWSDRLQHVRFGKVLKMSTRKGTAVFLEDVITESASIMSDQMKKNESKILEMDDPEAISRELGIAAIKIQDLRMNRSADYSFSWDRMKAFEGDTGPYLQYAHVRLSSIERKNSEHFPLRPLELCDTSLLSEPQAQNIIFHLGAYPDAVRAALVSNEASVIVTYAIKLAHCISSAWSLLKVKGCENDELAKARLWLFLLSRDVLGAALCLLTLHPLDRM